MPRIGAIGRFGPRRGGANQAPPGSPIPTVAPVVSGTPTQGQTLSVTNGTWTNSPTGYTYQWKANGAAISGATSTTYVLTASEVGKTVNCTVFATNANGTNYSNSNSVGPVASNVAAPVNTVAPAISGTTTEGQTLTVSNGTWSNSPTGYAYQWKRGGAAISGATTNTYALVNSDVGATITCDVTASNAGGSATASSAGVGPVAAAAVPVPVNSVAPAISGTATQGQTLTTTNGTWSNSPTGYAYQWRRGGSAISGATASTYTLVSADVGTNITCAVVASNAGGSGTAAVSNSLGPVVPLAPANTVAPVVSGTTTVGSTLTSTTGTWSNSPSSYAYQWKRGGVNISGATASTYVLVSGDLAANITCEVTASNAGGSGTPAVSNSVGPVTAGGGSVTTFTDNFDRADENLEASANWTKVSGATVGAAKIISNVLAATTTVENAYLSPDQGSAQQFVQYKNAGNGSAGPFVCARMTDMNNFVGIRSSTTSYQTWKRLNGTLVQINTMTGTPAVGDIVRLEIASDIATSLLNGAINGVTGSVSDIPASTRQGLSIRSQARNPTWIDDFTGGGF